MEAESKSASAQVPDVGVWAMNVISSVGIIMANKQLMSPAGYAFAFATTLTGLHFAVTGFFGFVSNAAGYSSAAKHVPLWELLWFSIVANLSITGMNLSLMLNSVGFYQISKLSMIPVVCVMEWVLHNKRYSTQLKVAVVGVVIGVGVCTVTDVKVNAKGFLCACVAVLATSLQQIPKNQQKHSSAPRPSQQSFIFLQGSEEVIRVGSQLSLLNTDDSRLPTIHQKSHEIPAPPRRQGGMCW